MELNSRRRKFNILVPEAHALGAIAVIRSLGRAGYKVHACSSEPGALGLKSNFASQSVLAPRYDDPTYVSWLRRYVREENIDAIVPSESFLHEVEMAYDEFKALMPLPDDKKTAYAAFSKIDVLETLLAAPSAPAWRKHLPPSLIVRLDDKIPSVGEIAELGGPFFLKGDGRDHNAGNVSLIQRLETAEEARAALIDARQSYDALLLQGWVGGVKAAASFCLDAASGRLLSETGVLGMRTTPHRGGMMTLRESWRHDALSETALSWLAQIGWRGVAMVECKWDPATDEFWLIEINARYWGYLHLDLFSGIDMPRIQMDRFFGLESMPPLRQKLGVRCRHTFPGDSSFLISLLKDPKVTGLQKVSGTLRFFADFVDPRLHSDLLFPGDRHLYWRQLGQFLRLIASSASRRLVGLRTKRKPGENENSPDQHCPVK